MVSKRISRLSTGLTVDTESERELTFVGLLSFRVKNGGS